MAKAALVTESQLDPTLDVHPIPHGQRHLRIFGCFARPVSGESFVLINSYDPKPLRREFAATHPDEFT